MYPSNNLKIKSLFRETGSKRVDLMTPTKISVELSLLMSPVSILNTSYFKGHELVKSNLFFLKTSAIIRKSFLPFCSTWIIIIWLLFLIENFDLLMRGSLFPEYKQKKTTPAKTTNSIVKMYFLCSLLIINQTYNKKQ